MPAVDPSRLDKQVEYVMEAFAEPRRLRSRCLDVLEFYASRVRLARAETPGGTSRPLGVPVAVLRELERGLASAAEDDAYAAAMAAETLWATPVYEARLLAIGVLEGQPVEDLPGWVAGWAQTANDSLLLERLATGPLRRLRRIGGELFWSSLADYFDSREPAQVTVGLLALQDAVPELDTAELPRVFNLLIQAPSLRTGEAWRAQVAVLRETARRSPSEAARFLVDEMDRARPGAARLARQILDEFPPGHQEALRQSLRKVATS